MHAPYLPKNPNKNNPNPYHASCLTFMLGFKPTTGLIERIEMQSAPDTWGYFAVGER